MTNETVKLCRQSGLQQKGGFGMGSSVPLMIRRVVGASMLPRLKPGNTVLAWRWLRSFKPGDVVIAHHNGREIIKRVERIESSRIFVVGDNLSASTDSRHYGWLPRRNVIAKVIWPYVHNT